MFKQIIVPNFMLGRLTSFFIRVSSVAVIAGLSTSTILLNYFSPLQVLLFSCSLALFSVLLVLIIFRYSTNLASSALWWVVAVGYGSCRIRRQTPSWKVAIKAVVQRNHCGMSNTTVLMTCPHFSSDLNSRSPRFARLIDSFICLTVLYWITSYLVIQCFSKLKAVHAHNCCAVWSCCNWVSTWN